MNDYQYTNEKGDYIDYWELVNDNGELCREIEKLQQENKLLKEKLKATNKGLIKVLSKRLKWKRRYYKEKYIRKELKKWLEEGELDQSSGEINPIIWNANEILDKIKELEEGVKNESRY